MKERLIVIFVFIIFIISMISASYKCEDNTTLIEDMGGLKLGEVDHINGITIGLSFTRDFGSKRLMEAEIYIDSKKVSLNDGNATTVQFSDDTDYSITLLNASENTANIKIGSDSKLINTLDSITIGGISVFLISSVGDYPGSPNVNILLGKSKLFLSSKNNSDEIIKFNEQEHLIELYSASDNEALITIKKCKNESIKIIQIADQINTSNNNSLNQTNNTAIKWYQNSTNSTVNGSSVKHSINWTDDVNLSGYIFSFDNGNGTLQNDSWVSMTGTLNWSNVTKVVNSTYNSQIQWKVYANDSNNDWNVTSTFIYRTANQSQNNSGNFTGNQEEENKYSGLIKTSSMIIIIIAFIIFIILLFKYLKNKSYQNVRELQED